MTKATISVLMIALCCSLCPAQQIVQFKQVDTTRLFMEVYYPEAVDSDPLPALVFYFGGGWISGNRSHFLNHAKYFSKRGIVCFLADYRTANKHQTTPFASLKDAKSAIRFIRSHASDFKVDPTKIIASGGSAGGHLAAATALIEGFNEESDDLAVSCIPNALVLFNPVIDNGPGGYGYERIGESYHDYSPLHNIAKGAPPTIFFQGTMDRLIPTETAEYYKKVMEKVEARCDLKLYEGEGHGFFNYVNFENYRSTVSEMDEFLVSLGYLKNEPVVKIE